MHISNATNSYQHKLFIEEIKKPDFQVCAKNLFVPRTQNLKISIIVNLYKIYLQTSVYPWSTKLGTRRAAHIYRFHIHNSAFLMIYEVDEGE